MLCFRCCLHLLPMSYILETSLSFAHCKLKLSSPSPSFFKNCKTYYTFFVFLFPLVSVRLYSLLSLTLVTPVGLEYGKYSKWLVLSVLQCDSSAWLLLKLNWLKSVYLHLFSGQSSPPLSSSCQPCQSGSHQLPARQVSGKSVTAVHAHSRASVKSTVYTFQQLVYQVSNNR